MTPAPLTPQEDHNDAHKGELRYDESFERDLARVVGSPLPADGIHVVYGEEKPGDNEVHIIHVRPQDLPDVQHEELPLSLNDPRRKFRSPIPGVKLTHPGGLLEGGPGSDHDAEDAQKFIDHFQIRSSEELRQRISEQTDIAIEELKSRVNARQTAIENNEKVDKELAQKEMEVRILQRMKDEAKERKKGVA
ncbi:hypothetical protein EV356DRAFT_535903 [Viridothelium virens]|uniref:Uncharacterized protein n=1 Tax=Viridothelium virens TaxID=1048519 RepID=A0A6A6GZF9_VIRVR|nr:hypothetical protein EV356DRAFT_535903 [Viridothelium virens]